MKLSQDTLISFKERASYSNHPLTKRIFTLMDDKKSNLAVSLDVQSCEEMKQLIEQVAPYAAIIKTHIDILRDYTPKFSEVLQALSKKFQFVLFEDRKFADIGKTVQEQYLGGIYQIAEWAPITNAHVLPGEGIIQGLAEIGTPRGNGLLLLAEMSSKGALFTEEYTKQAVEMAKKYREFVIGFISTQKITNDPTFIHMTPGVQLASGGDTLGQQYVTPEKAICERGTDIIIVGRGIYGSKSPSLSASQYQKEAWESYKKMI